MPHMTDIVGEDRRAKPRRERDAGIVARAGDRLRRRRSQQRQAKGAEAEAGGGCDEGPADTLVHAQTP